MTPKGFPTPGLDLINTGSLFIVSGASGLASERANAPQMLLVRRPLRALLTDSRNGRDDARHARQ